MLAGYDQETQASGLLTSSENGDYLVSGETLTRKWHERTLWGDKMFCILFCVVITNVDAIVRFY